jgi:polyisoprenoid-binding protein YceI
MLFTLTNFADNNTINKSVTGNLQMKCVQKMNKLWRFNLNGFEEHLSELF